MNPQGVSVRALEQVLLCHDPGRKLFGKCQFGLPCSGKILGSIRLFAMLVLIACCGGCRAGVASGIKTTDGGSDDWTWSAPEFLDVGTATNSGANAKWSSQLSEKADLVLEYRGENWFERYKPAGPGGEHVFVSGTNALANAIPGAKEYGRSLAVLILPSEWMLCANCQTLEETAYDLRDSLKASGFRRVTVVVTRWAMWFEMFSDGWPSREEIERHARKERSQSE